MILINERNEWLANKIVNVDSDMMFAGVVVGNNPGEVWVDNNLNPSSAIVWSSGLGSFNFMGSARNTYFNQSIEMLIDNEIIPFLKSKDTNSFEFSVDSKDWYPTIYQVFGNRKIDESFQYVYKSNINTNEILFTDILEPFRALEIDEILFLELNNGEIKNADFLINYIEQYWGTFKNYLGKGYGYVALTEKKEIVSIATSSFMFSSTHAIGVETLEDYKRQGLSSSLMKLLVKKYNENNIAAWWDCMESNIASQKTAEKAGLFKAHSYKINWFNF
ncbi:GNAT family N-acetyltransferase [Brevibacillus daliensis]|uniref:GNAT family N-acetyltransferase n=1 Tax=Brevibacillus daliensis TaxID=2892995 RepID=UPI001E3D389C|nr:GNAT family N-acetyltransferase [Brevibacillus daliensis]